jgi:hypothetical protein
MGFGSHFGSKLRNSLWATGLVLALAFSAGARTSPCAENCDGRRVPLAKGDQRLSSPPVSAEAAARQVTQYVMDFDGDHSLDLATVVEQTTGGFARYTVQLHLASGAEQSFVVAAPPGGLQLEMHDMTGDKIANDLILRPALLRWLPTVLLNDGHDHFAVAISGTNPDSLSSGQELDSKESDARGMAGLICSGFKTGRLANDRGLFLPQGQEDHLPPATQSKAKSFGYSPSSGRAPPKQVATA